MGALGAWGIRWIGELGDDDLDPHLLMWDIRRTISVDAWPRARTVLEFNLFGVDRKAAHWWLMVSEGVPDVCDFDPGYEVAATVETSLLTLTQIWRGDVLLVARAARRQRHHPRNHATRVGPYRTGSASRRRPGSPARPN